MTMTFRYRVVTQVPLQLRDRGFVAYVEDAEHPDGGPCSMSWHLSANDAERVANAMNRLALADYRERRDARAEPCPKTTVDLDIPHDAAERVRRQDSYPIQALGRMLLAVGRK